MKAPVSILLAICISAITLLQTAPAQGVPPAPEARTALIIGCDYKNSGMQLPSPLQDAASIAGVLETRLGFKVTVLSNPTRKEMLGAIDKFGAALAQSGGIGLFYFSGHGSQFDGDNFLIPAGAELGFREDLPTEAIAAQRIVTRMEAAQNRVNLLFLDACRTNDLPSTKKGAFTKGLTGMNAASGMLISFASAKNTAANDTGSGSCYTNALVKHLATPGLSVTDMLTLVNNDVKKETAGAQIPFMEVGLDGVFRFVDGAISAPASSVGAAAVPVPMAPPPAATTTTTAAASKPKPATATGASAVPTAILAEKATKDAPYVNSLGMKFVPVPIKGGPTDSQKSHQLVLVCIHETRKGDYRQFSDAVRGVNGAWKGVTHWDLAVSQTDDHPVVNVNWEDSVAFCEWLTKKEGLPYRLPTDHEWSCAAGIGELEDPDVNPEDKSGRVKDRYPWGATWPPPDKSGNYGDATSAEKSNFTDIERYDDGYATTAPVMSFPPNALGLYDLGGNAWEWCQDWYGTGEISKVLRGQSWWSSGGERGDKLSSYRFKDWANSYHARAKHYGFRCVIVVPAPL